MITLAVTAILSGVVAALLWFVVRDQIIPQREARLLRGEHSRVRCDDWIGMLVFASVGAIVGVLALVS